MYSPGQVDTYTTHWQTGGRVYAASHPLFSCQTPLHRISGHDRWIQKTGTVTFWSQALTWVYWGIQISLKAYMTAVTQCSYFNGFFNVNRGGEPAQKYPKIHQRYLRYTKMNKMKSTQATVLSIGNSDIHATVYSLIYDIHSSSHNCITWNYFNVLLLLLLLLTITKPLS